MTTVSTLGALVALAVAIVLILRKVPPAYGMIAGALAGGLCGGADLVQTVTLMIGGAQGITNAVMRILAAGVLAGVLIESGAAHTIAETIVRKVGETRAPRVMTDPEPQVFFLNFGASTLDHELRLYVRELRDRSYTVDELNRSIDRLCRENGIDIAFNQLEVYLHNQQGNEVQEVKRTLSPDEGGQTAG